MIPAKGRYSKESGTEIQKRPNTGGKAKRWYVYMVCCADRSLYTGVTTDIDRRLNEHNSNNRLAAAYTRARRPVVIVYKETLSSRSSALKREYAIRQLGSRGKQALVNKRKR